MPDAPAEETLNFAATRHGWTRSFTLSSEKVTNIDYTTLESVLELNTLKIRSMSLRIFVEHPPASGTFVKIRPWKDDGSLQSILMKAFFEERMKNGTTTTLDIRDGNVRENGIGEGGKDSGAREWLKAHGLTRTKSATGGESEEHDGETQSDVKVASQAVPAGSGFLSAFGFGRPPPVPSKSDESEGDGHATEGTPEKKEKTEEDILRERGWGPPIMRRLTSRKPRKSKSKTPVEEKDIQEEGDGEEIEIPEAEEANGGARPEKNALWRKKQNAFLGSPKKPKKGGAEIVRTPSDAMKPATPTKETSSES
ncbi:hypothetical protein BT96DRAFT_265535 [Gymnopus androsaceus JB14]|uniref:Uncharacterized protein n=1 Tax=Gymnopus androsaceus JB14 TaxID=1447944 RepID=A0A6A4H4F8_9AGAR|nr:hypothetical protein BT96DRAFT_265535 [Gymnopus androsaceus JB14]